MSYSKPGYVVSPVLLVSLVVVALAGIGSALYYAGLNKGNQLAKNDAAPTVTASPTASPTGSPSTGDVSPTPSASPTAVSTATPKATPTPAPATYYSDTPLDVMKLRVGDKVGEMTVASIQPYNKANGPLSTYNATVSFSGSVEAGATMINRGSGGVCGDYPDNVTVASLPKLEKYDFNNSIFCLTDQTAKSEFTAGARWHADVIIKDYVINMPNSSPGSSFSTATLVRVVNKNQY